MTDSQSCCLVVVDPPHPGLAGACGASFADSSPLVWPREVEVGSPQRALFAATHRRQVHRVAASRERNRDSCAGRERYGDSAVRGRVGHERSRKGRAVLDKEASSGNEKGEEASHFVMVVWCVNGVVWLVRSWASDGAL